MDGNFAIGSLLLAVGGKRELRMTKEVRCKMLYLGAIFLTSSNSSAYMEASWVEPPAEMANADSSFAVLGLLAKESGRWRALEDIGKATAKRHAIKRVAPR